MKIKLLLIILLFGGVLMAQDNEGQDRANRKQERLERLENLKIAYITKELDLTTEESQKFWPVYNLHNDRLKEVRSSLRQGKKFEEMTDADADVLIQSYIQTEYEKAKINEEMINELKPIIGSKRVVRLFKVEAKFKKEILNRTEKRKNQIRSERRNRN